jgi:hypothetical protein
MAQARPKADDIFSEDQFAILKQIGYLPESVARRLSAELIAAPRRQG